MNTYRIHSNPPAIAPPTGLPTSARNATGKKAKTELRIPPIVRVGVALTLIALAVPIATAADPGGHFLVTGPVTMSSVATFSFQPLAMFANTSDRMPTLTFRAAHVVAHEYEDHFVKASNVLVQDPSARREATFPLTDVTITLTSGRHTGWLGLLPQGGVVNVTTTSSATVFEPRTVSLVGGQVDTSQDSSDPSTPYYGVRILTPHVYAQIEAPVHFSGPGSFKLHGPDVDIQSRENETTFATGFDGGDALASPATIERWLVLDFSTSDITMQSSDPIDVAMLRVNTTLRGAATLDGASGTFATRSETFSIDNSAAYLSGDFEGQLTAVDERGSAAFIMELAGQLTSTNMRGTPIPLATRIAAPTGSAGPWLLLIALGGSTLVGAVVGARLQRRPKTEAITLSVEAYLDLANVAVESGRHTEALGWFEHARRLAPSSARLLMDEGHCHAVLGDVEAALAKYDEAARLSSDGEADYLAASLILGSGGAAESAEKHILRALERSPLLVLEVETDANLRRLRGRARVDDAIRRALARLDEAER